MLEFENQGVGWPIYIRIVKLESKVSQDNWIGRLQIGEIKGEDFDMKADGQMADDIICDG